jgi:metal-dependent hydrolase (beta-lactamase superfamily II)
MKKTTLTILIEKLEKKIKKTSLGGIKFYGLKEAQRLAKDLLIDEQREIRDAFNNGEMNVWNRDRDGNIFEYEGGEDYFNKEYKLNETEVDEELIALIKEKYAEELEQDRQAENQIEQEQINKF